MCATEYSEVSCLYGDDDEVKEADLRPSAHVVNLAGPTARATYAHPEFAETPHFVRWKQMKHHLCAAQI